MAEKTYLVSLDLNQNQLIQAVLENLAAHPSSPRAGRVYFNTVDKTPYVFDGTNWINLMGINNIYDLVSDTGNLNSTKLGAIGITKDGNNLFLNVNVDESTLTAGVGSGGTGTADDYIKIKAGGIANIHIASNAAIEYSKLESIASMRVVGNINATTQVAGEVVVVTLIDDSSTDAQLVTAKAVNDAIASAVTAVGKLVGNYTPKADKSYPTVGSGGSGVLKGDFWVISGVVVGSLDYVGSNKVNNGDVLYAKIKDPGTTDSNWFVVESNRGQATETALGLAKIATQTEANSGTDTEKYITPATLAGVIAHIGGIFSDHKLVYTLTGDGATKAFISSLTSLELTDSSITTNIIDFDTNKPVVMEEEVIYDLSNTPVSLTVRVNIAPASGKKYILTIIG